MIEVATVTTTSITDWLIKNTWGLFSGKRRIAAYQITYLLC